MTIHPHGAHAWSFWFVLTSLLLLLSIDQVQLLGLVKKLGPLFARRKLLVGREQGLGRRDPNSNLELRVSFSLHHAHGGRNVGIIATDCGANVPLTYEPINRRIETYPTNAGEKGFHPCMGSAVRRGMRILAAAVKVSTDIATRNFGISNECDHDMSKILTYTLSQPKGMLNRRTYHGALLDVVKTAMHTGGHPFPSRRSPLPTLQAPVMGAQNDWASACPSSLFSRL